MLKKSISIILSMALILSIFTIIPVSSSAKEVTAESEITDETASCEADIEFVEEEIGAQERTINDTGTSNMITVYFINTLNWSSVYIYTWSPELTSWPGIPMTFVRNDDNSGRAIYSAKIDPSVDGIVFNNGNNGQQTIDITESISNNSGWYALDTDADKSEVQWFDYSENYSLDATPVYSYELLQNENVKITKYQGIMSDVIIPDTIDGKRVTEIGSNAFAGKSVKSVRIPDSVSILGCGAFVNCKGLTSVYLPKDVETGKYAGNHAYPGPFYGCEALRNVEFADGFSKLSNALFQYCGIQEITLPNSLRTIGWKTFSSCEELRNIRFNSGLLSIGSDAFNNCISLERIALPDSLEMLGCAAFQNCKELTSVYLPKDVETGQYAGASAYPGPFSGCENLSEITFAAEYTKLSNALFKNTGIKDLWLPDTVNSIGWRTFSECPNLILHSYKYSGATIDMIDNNIPGTTYGDKRNNDTNILNSAESHYEFISSANVRVNCVYNIKNDVYKSASQYSVKFYIPDGADISEGSLYLDKKICTNYNEDKNYIKIPVTAKSGKISFNLKIEDDCKLRTYAILNYRMNNQNDYDIIDVINEDIQLVTLNADDVVSQDTITVSGLAPANSNVDVFIDDNKAVTLKANKAGSYSGDIIISEPENSRVYSVKAVSTDKNGNVITAENKIKYMDDAPELTEFTMIYNGKTYDLLSDKKQSITFVLESFHGKTPFSFRVKYKNSNQIGKVYISSIRNQIKKTVDAEWDQTSGSYVFNGYFDESNHDYVPGKILVQYTDKRPEKLSLTETQDELTQLLNANKDAFKDVQTIVNEVSDNRVEYKCDLSKINAQQDLGTDLIDLAVETILNATMDDWGDLLSSTFSTAENVYSYFDKNGDKYLMKQDFTKEGTWVTLFYDLSSNKILKYIIDGSSEFEQYSFTPTTAEKLSSKLSFVSTIVKPIKGIYDINEDYDELMKNIDISGMNFQEQEIARKRAEELKNDRMAFLAITTVMGALAIGMTGPIGVGAALMLGVMGAFGDYFFDMRTANILGGKSSLGFNWSIDPSGYVYAAVTSNRIEGATVTAYWIPYDEEDEDFWENPDESKAVIWDASEYSQINPLITDNDGNYAWDVPEGLWKVVVEKYGYQPYSTGWLPVPPPQTDVNINLMSTAVPDLKSATYNNGVITLSFSEYMKPETLNNIVVKDDKGATVSYAFDYSKSETDFEGNIFAKEYYLTINGNALSNQPEYTVTIKNSESYAGVKKSEIVKQTSIAYVIGDVNDDGAIDVLDAAFIQKHAVGKADLTPEQLYVADVNDDGIVDILDAAQIQKYAVGKITEFKKKA